MRRRRLVAIVAAATLATTTAAAAQDRSDEEAFTSFVEVAAGMGDVGEAWKAFSDDMNADSIAEVEALSGELLAGLEGVEVRPCFEDMHETIWVTAWLSAKSIELIEAFRLTEATSLMEAIGTLTPMGPEMLPDARAACLGTSE